MNKDKYETFFQWEGVFFLSILVWELKGKTKFDLLSAFGAIWGGIDVRKNRDWRKVECAPVKVVSALVTDECAPEK